MKINQLPDIAATTGPTGVKAGQGTPTAPTKAKEAEAGARVTVSTQAQSLDPVTAGDGVDMDRVNAVRESIANGSFKVDAESIADKLLSNAQEILSRVRGR